MNFVHFPKLDEYAIDPDIDDVVLDIDKHSDVLKSNSTTSRNIFPNVLQKKNKRVQKYDHQIRDNYLKNYRKFDKVERNRQDYATSRLNYQKDPNEINCSNRDIFSPRSNFFRKWDSIPLTMSGQDLSEVSSNLGLNFDSEALGNGDGLIPILGRDSRIKSLHNETISMPYFGLHIKDEQRKMIEIATFRRHKKTPKLWSVYETITQLDAPSLSNSGFKEDMDIGSHALLNTQIVDKFRKTISAVKVVLKLAKSIMKTSDSPSALLKTFMQLSKEPESHQGADASSENMKKYGLHFDPSYFKANREISLSSEVRSILKLHPNRRTPEQVQTTVFGLQSIPSFAEYPLHMQEKLAKVAWLDIVTPNRTIIRQGHFAENFYFIVSGQALVTIHRPGDSSAQTAALMRKGTSFGELALLHHSRRTATVTSHDTVQLLSVGRDDFFDIFMSRHIKGEVPEHIKYLSHLDFMKDWPMERLLERPDQCLLHFFKRNMVIVKESRSSEWLYVVKSGSCHVLKQLKGVTARIGQLRRGRSGENKVHKDLLRGNNVLEEKKSPRLNHRLGSIDANNSYLEKQTKLNALGVDSGHQLKSMHGSSVLGDDPVFVRIQLLKPMDVFGLDLVNFNNSVEVESTSVSLVSLGSECIMLSKSFFMKYANDKVKKRLSETVTPYPNEATLQDSLQHKVNWELYKESILSEASRKCKLLKRKHLTVYH